MDSFPLCLALGPVAIYLLLLGAVNLRRRPFLMSGARDTAALGLAVVGLVIVGPVELFFPNAAAARFGPWVWLFLLVLCVLALTLVLLTIRPRLIIYNISADELRPILADVVDKLDPKARWAGDSLALPHLGVQLHLDTAATVRNVSLVASGSGQNQLGWRKLEAALRPSLAKFEVPRNTRCLALLAAGVILAVILTAAVVADPRQIAQSMGEMLNR
jgi:hypothetical protein